MTESDKFELMEKLVNKWCDEMTIDALCDFFIQEQLVHLSRMSDNEFSEILKQNQF